MCATGQMRAVGGSVDSTGLWRKGGRRSMAIWQWLTKGLTTTPTTTTPPSNCTTQRYSYGPLQEYVFCIFFSSPTLLENYFLARCSDFMVPCHNHKFARKPAETGSYCFRPRAVPAHKPQLLHSFLCAD